jgi:hypothetical protein
MRALLLTLLVLAAGAAEEIGEALTGSAFVVSTPQCCAYDAVTVSLLTACSTTAGAPAADGVLSATADVRAHTAVDSVESLATYAPAVLFPGGVYWVEVEDTATHATTRVVLRDGEKTGVRCPLTATLRLADAGVYVISACNGTVSQQVRLRVGSCPSVSTSVSVSVPVPVSVSVPVPVIVCECGIPTRGALVRAGCVHRRGVSHCHRRAV